MENQWQQKDISELVYAELAMLRRFMESELKAKTQIIKGKDNEIGELKQAIAALEEKCQQALLAEEGSRQLVNKLLGDISRLQNDVDWYRRTYEERSFLGTVREKLFRKH